MTSVIELKTFCKRAYRILGNGRDSLTGFDSLITWMNQFPGIAVPIQEQGIMGFSYGGYATWAGLAFTPERYAAGASIVGPSNLITLMENIPPYWIPIQDSMSLRVGDPNNPSDYQRLRAQSPLFSADNIQAPLLVV